MKLVASKINTLRNNLRIGISALVLCSLILSSILATTTTSALTGATNLAFAQDTTQATVILCPIKSVKQGEPVRVAGYLANSTDVIFSTNPSGYPNLNSQRMTFAGDGVPGGFSADTTNDYGFFAANFASPNTVSGWTVNASFAGDADYLGTFALGTYTTAPIHAIYNNSMMSGSGPQHVDLAGLNFSASMDFSEILPPDGIVCEFSDPPLLVAECSAPVTNRFTPVRLASNDLEDICLEVFPSANFVGMYNVTISFDGRGPLPDGFTDSDVDLFFQDTSSGIISEVTTARGNDDNKVISGTASSVGKFIVAIGNHGEAPPGAVRQHVLVGNNQSVAFRDIDSSVGNATTTITHTDATASTMAVDIHFDNANINRNEVDTVSVNVNSTSSGSAFITVPFTETGPNTGTFSESFSITSSSGGTTGSTLEVHDGDTITILPAIQAYYGRLQATFNGISEAGAIELSDGEFGEGFDTMGFSPVVQPVNVTLVDAKLAPDADVTITMSYGNGLFKDSDSITRAPFLKLYHKPAGGSWDTSDPDLANTIVDTATNTTSRTITGLIPGLYVLGFDGSDPGGAGGGVGKPGVGIVLDFIAALPASPVSSHHRGGGEIPPIPTTQPISTARNDTYVATPTGSNVEVTASTRSGTNITLSFDRIVSPGNVTISEKVPSTLGNILDSMMPLTQRTVLVGNNSSSSYSIIGQAYDITTSGIAFTGFVDVTIPYNETLVTSNEILESDLRFLHYNGSKWEDATISIDTEANTITGRLYSLSPIIVGRTSDGTFGESYFELHPLGKMSIFNATLLSSSASSRNNNNDSVITNAYAGEGITILATVRNIQKTDQMYSFIVEILDQHDVVDSIIFENGSLAGGQSSQVVSQWMPERAGTHVIKIFLWSDDGMFGSPLPLSDMNVEKVQVV
jgi:hypothetical protein